jgi:GNAT superfamily N-acetyltransferase
MPIDQIYVLSFFVTADDDILKRFVLGDGSSRRDKIALQATGMAETHLTFKFAITPDEFEQVHRLNYRTFVEEIPQHPPNAERRLVDKFHDENTYCICLDGSKLVGMLALRDQRPFSLDAKVPDLDRWLPVGVHLCEIRLLAVEPAYRGRALFADLLGFAATESIRRGYTLALASGTLRQSRLYRHLGFIPFYEPVGHADALFQPMYLPLDAVLTLTERLKR